MHTLLQLLWLPRHLFPLLPLLLPLLHPLLLNPLVVLQQRGHLVVQRPRLRNQPLLRSLALLQPTPRSLRRIDLLS
jgi:hypothetical protein